MTSNIKTLSSSLQVIWASYRDDKAAAVSSAAETIEAEMVAVKAEEGLAGLRVSFHDDQDGSGAILETKVGADDWENWDELGYGDKDADGRLRALSDHLVELAPYLEWNGVEITV